MSENEQGIGSWAIDVPLLQAEIAALKRENEALNNVLSARGETVLANYWIGDEFRQTLHDYIDEQAPGEWITLIRYRPERNQR